MSQPTLAARLSLRQLPFPAKLVITCFLMAVGLGYTAAMVQLHMQDSKSGSPMPTLEDVVLKFTGKKWFTSAPPRAVSKLEKLIMGPIEGAPWNGNGSMAPAFFKKDGGDYSRLSKDATAKAKLDAEREGERIALQLWINAPADDRKKAYDEDKFVAPADKAPKAITPEFAVSPKLEDGFKVRSILHDRCVRCHAKGEAQESMPLETYDHCLKYLTVAAAVEVPPGGGWVRVEEPIGMEKLTQSTHAHLLSFAMLFSLTGLVFAFSSYPAVVRCILGPLALLAVFADVSLWWLARLSDAYGPYFAMCITGTGGLAGLSLAGQITLSLFNLYGTKGKLALLLVFAVGAGLGGAVFMKVIDPALKDKQERLKVAQEAKEAKPAPAATPPADVNPPKKSTEPAAKVEPKVVPPIPTIPPDGPPVVPPVVPPVRSTPSKLESLVTGMYVPKGPFGGKAAGGMVRAFFDKEEVFAEAVKEKSPTLPRLTTEREGEQAAMIAWIQAPDDVRKKAYDENRFTLPSILLGKPITPSFKADDKTLKVKTLLAERCEICHAAGRDQEEYPLDSYDALKKYLGK